MIAETLRDMDLTYIALNPGASYRGLHDSIVNYLGNKNPEMLLCLHEEHAIHIAQGYAKVTDKPMACAVHSNVGPDARDHGDLQRLVRPDADGHHGRRRPIDADKRRPWIDWIHTSRDQGAMIRNYVKYDDMPMSPAAAREALARAKWHSVTAPKGPVYVNLDVHLQEDPLKQNFPPSM